MGGGGGEIPLPGYLFMHKDLTVKGKWMYEPMDVKRLIMMVEMGIVKLNREGDKVVPYGAKVLKKYGLDDWNKAFEDAWDVGSTGNVVIEP